MVVLFKMEQYQRIVLAEYFRSLTKTQYCMQSDRVVARSHPPRGTNSEGAFSLEVSS
jgi:hypothetical protein